MHSTFQPPLGGGPQLQVQLRHCQLRQQRWGLLLVVLVLLRLLLLGSLQLGWAAPKVLLCWRLKGVLLHAAGLGLPTERSLQAGGQRRRR